MKKAFVTIGIAAGLTIAMSMTAFAGWDQMGAAWKYQNTDGVYLANTWAWIDGNNDGIAESYCFDGNGNLYVNVRTPDQYVVNENGAWTVNGVVQTMVVGGGSDNGLGTNSNGLIPGTNIPSTGDPAIDAIIAENQQGVTQGTDVHYSNDYTDQGEGLSWGSSSQKDTSTTDNGLIPGTNIPSTGDPAIDAIIAEQESHVEQGGIGEHPDDYVDQGEGLNWN